MYFIDAVSTKEIRLQLQNISKKVESLIKKHLQDASDYIKKMNELGQIPSVPSNAKEISNLTLPEFKERMILLSKHPLSLWLNNETLFSFARKKLGI